MRIYFLFFLTYTIMELVFTGFYFLVLRKIDITYIMGTALYAFGMMKCYNAYQQAKYRQKKRKLLQSLP